MYDVCSRFLISKALMAWAENDIHIAYREIVFTRYLKNPSARHLSSHFSRHVIAKRRPKR